MKRSLRSWLWRVDITQEVDEELAFHIEMRTRELVERGVDPRVAREMVLARLGDVGRLKRTCVDLGRKREREMRLTQWLEEFRDDVRFAIRQLKVSPGFTFVAAITLALGIGANGAIFALVDATLLRPLPLPEPERLAIAWERSETALRGPVSPLNMLDWRDRNRTFEKMAGFIPGVGSMVMAGPDGTAEGVPRQWVTSGVFDVLGVRPIAGRTFLPSDDTQEVSAVVLSEGFWRNRFGADPSVIGQQIRLDGIPFTVVGVVPQATQLIGRASVWALVQLRRDIGGIPGGPSPERLRGLRVLRVVGRVKPGISLDAANDDLSVIATSLASEFPSTNKGRSVRLEPMRDVLIGGDLRLTSLLFLGVVGFVLLICCANVANLLLARAAGRTRELAIRSALGAGRRRIVRQLLTESLVLALIGGALGIGVGVAILRITPSVIPDGLLPTAVAPAFDLRVGVFCAVVTLVLGMLFGLAPAWHTRGVVSSAQSMVGGTRTTTAHGSRIRAALVVSEIAAAVLLLVGAGLLVRTLLVVDNVPRGYRADSVLTVFVDPLGGRYPTKESLVQFFNAIEREISGDANVRSTAWASTLPLGESTFGPSAFEIVGDPTVDEDRRPTANYQIVSPTYFSTLDLPVVAGRAFTAADTADSVPVCIVNEAFVRRHMQGRSAVGARVAVRSPTSGLIQAREVVGVARQVKGRPDEAEDFVQLYVPLAQDPFDDIFLLVRPKAGPAAALGPSVRAAIARVDQEQLVTVGSLVTLDDIAFEATARHRFRAVLVLMFAGLALLLAMVGVFGIIAYSVQQRVREFGVRIALGATASQVLGLVLGGAARMIGIGAAIGLAAAVLLSRSISAFLFGVEPLDPVTFVTVASVLAATATAAALLPAMRAARVDPVEAFRTE
jgi:putative ABC transport system permease protein